MSGFWIKWSKGLTRKREVLQIAARLMVPPVHAAGSLMLVMEWLDDEVTELSRDGHAEVRLGSLPTSFIDGIAGINGFAEALVEVQWLRIEGDVLQFLNVGKHNGTSAKSRALASERKRSERSRSSHAPIVTKKAAVCSVSESPLISKSEASKEDVIYAAYPRKVGRQSALKAIRMAIGRIEAEQFTRTLTIPAHDWLLSRAAEYATATASWPSEDRKFIPHPASWFNGGRYDDDPQEWKRNTTLNQPRRQAGFAR